MSTDDQIFLNTELLYAVESGDSSAEKLVYLHYQQAVLQVLHQFHPCCEADADKDFTLLKWRIVRLMQTTQHYLALVSVLPLERIQHLFSESRPLLRPVGELCPACQEHIRQEILSTFRMLRTTR